jgi:hypothetical protein
MEGLARPNVSVSPRSEWPGTHGSSQIQAVFWAFPVVLKIEPRSLSLFCSMEFLVRLTEP